MKYYTYEILEISLSNSFKKTNKFYRISNEKTKDHIFWLSWYDYREYSRMYDRSIVLRYTQKSLFTAVVADLKTRHSSNRH